MPFPSVAADLAQTSPPSMESGQVRLKCLTEGIICGSVICSDHSCNVWARPCFCRRGWVYMLCVCVFVCLCVYVCVYKCEVFVMREIVHPVCHQIL